MADELPQQRLEVRNPLGIIALFISFIYALSTGVLALRADQLGADNQTVMIVFITVFPVLVFATFAWLVAFHHEKLYSPRDFRSDEGFHLKRSSPERLGSRLAEELAASEGLSDTADQLQEVEANPADVSSNPVAAHSQNEGGQLPNAPSLPSGLTPTIAQAFLAEGLAFQQLQEDFQASLRRHVRVGPIEIDGMLETAGERIAVEIKLVGSSRNVGDRLYRIDQQFRRIRDALGPTPHRFVGVLVVTDESMTSKIQAFVDRQKERSPVGFETRIYSLNGLMRKYGISTEA